MCDDDTVNAERKPTEALYGQDTMPVIVDSTQDKISKGKFGAPLCPNIVLKDVSINCCKVSTGKASFQFRSTCSCK